MTPRRPTPCFHWILILTVTPQNLLQGPMVCLKEMFIRMATKKVQKKTKMCFRRFSATLIFLTPPPTTRLGPVWFIVDLGSTHGLQQYSIRSHVLSQIKVKIIKIAVKGNPGKKSLDFKFFTKMCFRRF